MLKKVLEKHTISLHFKQTRTWSSRGSHLWTKPWHSKFWCTIDGK